MAAVTSAVRAEPCACGATLRFPHMTDEWPSLMLAHVRCPQHMAWEPQRPSFAVPSAAIHPVAQVWISPRIVVRSAASLNGA